MTAIAKSRAQADRSGIRPVNPRRDMHDLATLIEDAFGGNLDAEGRNMVRGMRLLGRAGWIGMVIGRLILPPAAFPLGFVWEEKGKVVGNASILPVGGFPQRWVLANVAVSPPFRTRGIAKALVRASVGLIRERGGSEIVLQVEPDNQAALSLYGGMGFRTTTTRTQWTRRRGSENPPGDPSSVVMERSDDDWQDQWDLAQRLHPEGLIWPYPLRSSLFRSTGVRAILGGRGGRHWILREKNLIEGSLSARWWFERGVWRLLLLLTPETQGRAEGQLLMRCLTDLSHLRGGMVLDYPTGIADSQLRSLGFQSDRTLTWMSVDIESASPS